MAGKAAGGPPWATTVPVLVLRWSQGPFPPDSLRCVAIGTERAVRTLQRRGCAEGGSSESPIYPKGPQPRESGVGSPASPPLPTQKDLFKDLLWI